MLGLEYTVVDKTDTTPACVELNAGEVQRQILASFDTTIYNNDNESFPSVTTYYVLCSTQHWIYIVLLSACSKNAF